MRRWLRYATGAVGFTVVVVAIGWTFLPEEGGRGVLVAGAIALPFQLIHFGGLAAQPTGSTRFMAAWVGGTLLRLVAVAGAAFWVASMEGVDTLASLLALVGLFFVLLLLEPWALREGTRVTDPTGRSGNES